MLLLNLALCFTTLKVFIVILEFQSAALEKRERTRLLSSKGHLKDFLLLFGLTSKKCTFERDTNQLLPGCLGLSQV